MTIDLTSDTIDIRDIIERVEELENEVADTEAQTWANRDEYAELTAILDELAGSGGDEQWRGDWYPLTLIRESHFEEYMDEMVHDCYEVPKNLPSFMSIVLDYVALQQDYTAVEINGATYFYR
jgi:hypothetical protein